MIIERQNILDLIGKNKHKYSSCIITCFSFDFTFFEERLMSLLRTSNIKNVNVFLDGKCLDKSLEKVTGNEFRTHKTYSLNPIYEKGVFHPKIMLFTGPKQGLLILGSGNVTSSGLSTNDEIWAAFHLNSVESKNAHVFASVWSYLQQFFRQVRGFNREKIGWIHQYAPWINELDTSLASSFIKLNEEQEVRFIANTPEESIYQQLQQALPKFRIRKLSIVSPFFDEQGKLLEELNTDYEILEMLCITDREFGLLPSGLNTELQEKVRFYDWKECLEGFDKRFNRLHAKIFQFEYEDGWEYLLIGSPNATSHAFGTGKSRAVNGEAALLLKRKLKNGYLTELGISTRNAIALNVTSCKRVETNRGDNGTSLTFMNRVIYSEKNGSRITVYLQKEIETMSQLQILGVNQEEVELISFEPGKDEYTIEMKRPEDAFRVSIFRNGERITNFSLVHNVAAQARCNPDPSQAELNQIIESLLENPENGQYVELLKYTDFVWVDEERGESGYGANSGAVRRVTSADNHRVYESLTEEAFNELPSLSSGEADLLNNPSNQIADLLNVISKGLTIRNQEVEENAEEALAMQEVNEQQGEGEAVPPSLKLNGRGDELEGAVLQHTQKLHKFYQNELLKLFIGGELENVPMRPITMKDLSNLSIGVDLLYIFYGKRYALTKTVISIQFDDRYLKEIRRIEKKFNLEKLKRTDPEVILAVFYKVDAGLFPLVKKALLEVDESLWIEQEDYSVSTEYVPYFVAEGVYNVREYTFLKETLIEVLGSFLICANSRAGFYSYSYEPANKKMMGYRKSVFERATFLLLNVHWQEKEQVSRDLIFLDLLHFVSPCKFEENETGEIKQNLQAIYHQASHKSDEYFQNLSYYLDSLFPRFIQWKNAYESDLQSPERRSLIKEVASLHSGTIVFNSKIGFAILKQKGETFLLLEKPGFPWDDELSGPYLKLKYPQEKIITF